MGISSQNCRRISRVVHGLAQKIGARGCDVHVITCWEMGTREFERDKYVKVHRLHSYDVTPNNFVDWVLHLNFAIVEHATRLINETGKFDIIHAHGLAGCFCGESFEACLFNTSCCNYTCHGNMAGTGVYIMTPSAI